MKKPDNILRKMFTVLSGIASFMIMSFFIYPTYIRPHIQNIVYPEQKIVGDAFSELGSLHAKHSSGTISKEELEKQEKEILQSLEKRLTPEDFAEIEELKEKTFSEENVQHIVELFTKVLTPEKVAELEKIHLEYMSKHLTQEQVITVQESYDNHLKALLSEKEYAEQEKVWEEAVFETITKEQLLAIIDEKTIPWIANYIPEDKLISVQNMPYGQALEVLYDELTPEQNAELENLLNQWTLESLTDEQHNIIDQKVFEWIQKHTTEEEYNTLEENIHQDILDVLTQEQSSGLNRIITEWSKENLPLEEYEQLITTILETET